MNFTLTLFYLFSFILISSALVVVSARNMVHSVMFLVLAFLNAAAIFILLGAEFLAMLLIVVYVGAIAVLFLFVVMMMDINLEKLGQGIAFLAQKRGVQVMAGRGYFEGAQTLRVETEQGQQFIQFGLAEHVP